jgi:hypothetical protein
MTMLTSAQHSTGEGHKTHCNSALTVMLVSCVICSAYDSDRPTTEAAPPCSTARAAAENADSAPSVSSRMLSHLQGEGTMVMPQAERTGTSS